MQLKNILLLDKDKKTYNTKYEIADLLKHVAENGIFHYIIENIRVKAGFGVYVLRTLEDNSVFDWDVEIVDKTKRIKLVA